ncbi:MAG: GxxExxY protein [Phycisphaerales bacterium]|nr:GxxExxY protein [Phycisphaerales bacterium]
MSDYRNDGRGESRGSYSGGYGSGGGGSGGGGRGRGGYGNSGRDGNRDGGRDGGQRRGIPLSELDPTLTSISHKVIGCARDVHIALGGGYDESTYMTALQQEMRAQGVNFKHNHSIPVKYKDQVVGHSICDLFIEDRFIVDVMARYGEVSGAERSVLRAQLKAADLELGLIINFAGRLLKDGLVRVLNVDKINAAKGIAPGSYDGGEGGPSDDSPMYDFDEKA